MNPNDPGAVLIRDNELRFDGGDKLNGSLYLCRPSASSPAAADAGIERLRAAGLWSAQPAKKVEDAQKAAYIEQMIFVESQAITMGGESLILARYDHPKFPSSAERFGAWKKCLAGA
jgi:hypothetical protein